MKRKLAWNWSLHRRHLRTSEWSWSDTQAMINYETIMSPPSLQFHHHKHSFFTLLRSFLSRCSIKTHKYLPMSRECFDAAKTTCSVEAGAKHFISRRISWSRRKSFKCKRKWLLERCRKLKAEKARTKAMKILWKPCRLFSFTPF